MWKCAPILLVMVPSTSLQSLILVNLSNLRLRLLSLTLVMSFLICSDRTLVPALKLCATESLCSWEQPLMTISFTSTSVSSLPTELLLLEAELSVLTSLLRLELMVTDEAASSKSFRSWSSVSTVTAFLYSLSPSAAAVMSAEQFCGSDTWELCPVCSVLDRFKATFWCSKRFEL